MKSRLTASRPTPHRASLRETTARDGGLAETNNESLIFRERDCAGKFGSLRCHNAAVAGRLNAFFANSMNSLSMSMVNFSCCVCCSPDVTREVTAQPTRSAVRMEAWVHAGV
jgi:hypothetical protein